MLEVGKQVKITNLKEGRYGEIGTIKEIRSGLFTYPIVVQFGVTWDNFKEEDLEFVVDKQSEVINQCTESNKIERITNVKKSIIEWNIVDDRYIEIEVTGDDFHIVSLLKCILKETELYNYKYSRVSPFKIYKAPYSKESDTHDFILEFVDVKDHYKLKTNKLISTSRTMTFKGKIKLFIPDLLEICVDRGILKRNNDGYILNKSLVSKGCSYEYIESKPSMSLLKNQGFVIPSNY